jgi:hypothetical protein
LGTDAMLNRLRAACSGRATSQESTSPSASGSSQWLSRVGPRRLCLAGNWAQDGKWLARAWRYRPEVANVASTEVASRVGQGSLGTMAIGMRIPVHARTSGPCLRRPSGRMAHLASRGHLQEAHGLGSRPLFTTPAGSTWWKPRTGRTSRPLSCFGAVPPRAPHQR